MRILTCLFIVSILFARCTSARQDVARPEEALRQKVNTFMQQHTAEWASIEKTMMDTGVNFRSSPFFQSYLTFLKDNGNEYATLRTARFKQYAPPPAALKAFGWKRTSSMEGAEKDLDMMSLVFVRSFEPGYPAQMALNILIPGITSDYAMPMEEMTNYYQLRDIFGYQLYTEHAGGDEWQVWYADRRFAINFQFNVRTATLHNLRYADVQPIQWPASLVKAADEATSLWSAIIRTMWDAYQSYEPDKQDLYKAQRNTTLGSFYEKHQAQFIRAREEQLAPLSKPAPTLTGYKELTSPGAPLFNYTDTLYAAHTFIYPEQWETAIESGVNVYYELDVNERIRHLQRKGVMGVQRFAKQSGKNQWAVWAVSDVDAMYYVWNVKTGTISDVRYWMK